MNNITDIPRTAMEVFNMLPEGTRCEVIDNTLYMSPSPGTNHQDILGDIFFYIKQCIKQNQVGKVFIAPLDVYLSDEADVVQPDIVYISKEKSGIIKKKGIYGIPNLVIELLSSNKEYDTRKKFDLYQRNRIPEYIIINPDTKEVLHYLLTDGLYIQVPSQNGRLTLKVLNTQISF
jgi:Uma2 family endonuclease